MRRTATKSGQSFNPVARLGHGPHRGLGQRLLDRLGVRCHVTDGTSDIPLAQTIQAAVAEGGHIALNGGTTQPGDGCGLRPGDPAMQKPKDEHLTPNMGFGVRLALGIYDPLLVVGQGNCKPGHLWLSLGTTATCGL